MPNHDLVHRQHAALRARRRHARRSARVRQARPRSRSPQLASPAQPPAARRRLRRPRQFLQSHERMTRAKFRAYPKRIRLPTQRQQRLRWGSSDRHRAATAHVAHLVQVAEAPDARSREIPTRLPGQSTMYSTLHPVRRAADAHHPGVRWGPMARQREWRRSQTQAPECATRRAAPQCCRSSAHLAPAYEAQTIVCQIVHRLNFPREGMPTLPPARNAQQPRRPIHH